METRLQKILAQAGIGSRRECEKLISQGRVTVDGRLITKLGTKADPNTTVICVDGERISLRQGNYIYLVLHKPTGYVTTTKDPEGRSVVTSLLPEFNVPVQPVGRLDYNSEGLILFTNDGEFAHRVMHPSFGIEKEYTVKVSGKPTTDIVNRLVSGVRIEGSLYRCISATIVPEKRTSTNTWVRVTLIGGKNREIRKLFWRLGYPVSRLIRTRIGPIQLGNLPPKNHRFLSDRELCTLRSLLFGKMKSG